MDPPEQYVYNTLYLRDRVNSFPLVPSPNSDNSSWLGPKLAVQFVSGRCPTTRTASESALAGHGYQESEPGIKSRTWPLYSLSEVLSQIPDTT